MDHPDFSNIRDLLSQMQTQITENRVPHARLITGKSGSGLLEVALLHAAELLTGDPKDQRVWDLNHPDLHFSFPVVLKSGVSSSDDYMQEWREQLVESTFFNLTHWTNRIAGDVNKSAIIGKDESERITHKLNLKSYMGGRKVMIMWRADLMHLATANKLLKLIEEPPKDTFLILLAQESDELLPTIISRCQKTTFNSIPVKELAPRLETELSIAREDALNLAALAEGDLYAARMLADGGEEDLVFHELFVTWMRLCYKKDVPGIIDWVDSIHGLKRERQKRFLEYSLNFFRQCMLEKHLGADHALLFGKEKAFAGKFGRFVHSGNVVELMELFDREHYHIERNANAKLVMLDLSFSVIRLLHKPLPYEVQSE